MLKGLVDGCDVRAVPPASGYEIPRVLARRRCEQDEAGSVRLSAQQGQTVASVLARAVQYHHQRGRTPHPVSRRDVEVSVSLVGEPQRPQAGRRRSGIYPRKRARQKASSPCILFHHARLSIPCFFASHAPVLRDATIQWETEGGKRMDRDRLLDDLRWLAYGNPRYAGTSEEGQQDPVVAHLMADDLLLSYIDDQEVT
jgi:hypothetical protein